MSYKNKEYAILRCLYTIFQLCNSCTLISEISCTQTRELVRYDVKSTGHTSSHGQNTEIILWFMEKVYQNAS